MTTIGGKLIEWMQEAYRKDQHIIVLGDFNENAKYSRKEKYLITKLIEHDLYDLHETLAGEDTLDTWKKGELSSRIDYIFCNEDLLKDIISHEVIDIDENITDHKALIIKFKVKDKLDYDKSNYLKNIGKQFRIIKLDKEDWKELAEIVEESLIRMDEKDLDHNIIWDTITEIYTENYNEIIKKKEQHKNTVKQNKSSSKRSVEE